MTSLITHDFPLRDDLLVRLTLPVDLTHDDAARMCGFIASLAFASPASPIEIIPLKPGAIGYGHE